MAGDVILRREGLTYEFHGFMAIKDVNLRVRRRTIHVLTNPGLNSP
jgi:branched-chain amino acid transport system ATP-binding protein